MVRWVKNIDTAGIKTSKKNGACAEGWKDNSDPLRARRAETALMWKFQTGPLRLFALLSFGVNHIVFPPLAATTSPKVCISVSLAFAIACVYSF